VVALRMPPRPALPKAENIIVAPDCGMKYCRARWRTQDAAMVEGAAIVRRELEGK